MFVPLSHLFSLFWQVVNSFLLSSVVAAASFFKNKFISIRFREEQEAKPGLVCHLVQKLTVLFGP